MKTYWYYRGFYEGQHVLLFDEEFLKSLPVEHGFKRLTVQPDYFDAEIYDILTGKSWLACYTYPAYETFAVPIESENWAHVWVWSLHRYFYGGHWCGCHRISDIESVNPNCDIVTGETEEEWCPKDRLFVTRLWHASRPDVILYYEDVPDRPDLSPLVMRVNDSRPTEHA